MILLQLFIRFFFVGLFAVGGGLATLPFLYEMATETGWFTASDISNLVAISESTPGPMGVNMSTYVGFITSGPLGSVVGPLGLVTPSIIVIVIVSFFLSKFKESKTVQNVFYGLRPASTALIASAGLGILKLAFVGSTFSTDIFTSRSFWISVVMAVVIYVAMKKFKLHPVVFIALSAVAGIVFQLNIA
jgi:chromate transporter